MSNVVKFCSCRVCKGGRRNSRSTKWMIKYRLRVFRHHTKVMTKTRHFEEIPLKVSIPYTD